MKHFGVGRVLSSDWKEGIVLGEASFHHSLSAFSFLSIAVVKNILTLVSALIGPCLRTEPYLGCTKTVLF